MKRGVAVDLSVLRASRDLRLLVIGELFSGLGSQAALVAIPFQIYVRGRMSAIFMLVVTSGPRLGDLEAGLAASLTTAGVAVVSGGLVCVAGVFEIMALFPALAAYDGRVKSGGLA